MMCNNQSRTIPIAQLITYQKIVHDKSLRHWNSEQVAAMPRASVQHGREPTSTPPITPMKQTKPTSLIRITGGSIPRSGCTVDMLAKTERQCWAMASPRFSSHPKTCALCFHTSRTLFRHPEWCHEITMVHAMMAWNGQSVETVSRLSSGPGQAAVAIA
jgi:hypothetical protein